MGFKETEAVRLKYYCEKQNKFKPHFSCLPLPPHKTDLYILSVHTLYKEDIKQCIFNSYLPVIAFGPAGHLRLALNLGCSDFLKDPWSFEELFIRSERAIKGLSLDISNTQIRFMEASIYINSQRINLTTREIILFRLLLKMRGTPVSKETLASLLKIKNGNQSRAVDMMVSNLRKKIDPYFPKEKSLIKAEKNLGYYLVQEAFLQKELRISP